MIKHLKNLLNEGSFTPQGAHSTASRDQSKLYYRKHLSKNVTIHYFCLYLFFIGT